MYVRVPPLLTSTAAFAVAGSIPAPAAATATHSILARIDLSVRVFYVMGPLFFLVLLVPFTLNGFAVREAFFVSFLGQLGVDGSAAFAAGFLFFVVTIALSLPGAAVLAWEGMRATVRPTVDHGAG